jgi:RHS repeat-associated protein
VKTFTFATANAANDWANGKLRTAVANNYYDPNSPTTNFLSQETYTYGGVGGHVSQRDTLAGIVGGYQGTFIQNFTWSDLGVPATVTYPQKAGVGPARTVTFDLTNGWLTRVHEGTTNYASSISYHANGMVNQVTRPNSTTDTFAKDANDIVRPASVTVRGPLGLTLWTTGTYTWDGVGNIKAMGSDTFFYDKVSRLLEGKITSVSKKQCNSYDAFGNIKGQATVASSQTCTPSSWSVDSATNRFLSPITYDSAGEQLSWNSGAYVYGWYPTGQMRQFDGSARTTIYGYTADGERVGAYDSYAPSGVSYTLRGLDGKVLRVYRESGGVWTWVQDYVYRDGALLATIDSAGTRHVHLDHLGTIRLTTNSSGSQVALHTYLPFGQEATSPTQDAERMKFTGQERDLRDPSNTTDDLDYMHARHSNPNLGRFLSVDPGRDWHPAKPQSWNMYAYARNNPLRLVDPTGMAIDEYTTGTTANSSSGFLGSPAGSRQAEKAREVAGIIYNETSAFRPQKTPEGKPDPASSSKLHQGRVAVGKVKLNIEAAKSTNSIAGSEVTDAAKKTPQWTDSLSAAEEAVRAGGDPKGPLNLFLRAGPLTPENPTAQPRYLRGKTPVASFGPFVNPVKVGDVPVSNDIWIDIYNVR